MSLVLGIDDAGRGPLIGPMILAGVLMRVEDEDKLDEAGVDDSKQITHPKRVRLAEMIKEEAIEYHVEITTPEEIDRAVLFESNLNTLEAQKAANIINVLTFNRDEKIKVVVDCPSVNTQAWKKTMMGFVKEIKNLEVYCEHKADANHTSVSAASILAKVTREEEVMKLKEKYGDFGSGYPSDPYTKKFLKEKGKNFESSGIFRKSWSTWQEIFGRNEIKNSNRKNQATLGEF